MINLRLTASVKSPMSPMQLKNWRTHHLIFLTVNVLSFFLLLADKPLTHRICLWLDNEYERCHQYWLTNLAWAHQKRANLSILNTSNRILINKKNYFWFPFILNRVRHDLWIKWKYTQFSAWCSIIQADYILLKVTRFVLLNFESYMLSSKSDEVTLIKVMALLRHALNVMWLVFNILD